MFLGYEVFFEGLGVANIETVTYRQQLAMLLIEKKMAEAVADNFEKFDYDTPEQKQILATLLIEKEKGYAVADNLE